MDGDLRTLDKREYSHRLARGMRRDLFRRIDDRYKKCSPVLRKRLEVTRWPHRSVRARCEAYYRAYRALKDTCAWSTSYHGPGEVGGLGMWPCVDRTHGNAFEDEDVLRVDCVHLRMMRGKFSYDVMPMAHMSSHAVERIFQRLNTFDVKDAEIEVASSMGCLALLGPSLLGEGVLSRVSNVVIPTRRGALLGRFGRGPDVLDLRTFVGEGASSKIRESVQSIREWQNGESRQHIKTLLADRRNQWWRQGSGTVVG